MTAMAGLVREEPLLAVKAATVPRKGAARGDEPMTGHDNRNRVRAVGVPN
jgi:hypothetical protein